MEIGGPGEEETVKVEVATEKEEYDKELEERFRSELNGFYDMFVESSTKPGRTEMLYFHFDTGNGPPIKQQPYRVSLAEGEVMEAEILQYLENKLIRL
ncbi:hypothetical protein PInf_017202 [Phytophthora infestans]|nr:hypothetical protein PInf_017202 [Phytophthora infestans]